MLSAFAFIVIDVYTIYNYTLTVFAFQISVKKRVSYARC